MGPNYPNHPSNVPGLTNDQAYRLLRGLLGPTILGPAAVDLGAGIFNTFGGGSSSSSPWKHRETGQDTHQN
jgi:hypothetical protein